MEEDGLMHFTASKRRCQSEIIQPVIRDMNNTGLGRDEDFTRHFTMEMPTWNSQTILNAMGFPRRLWSCQYRPRPKETHTPSPPPAHNSPPGQ